MLRHRPEAAATDAPPLADDVNGTVTHTRDSPIFRIESHRYTLLLLLCICICCLPPAPLPLCHAVGYSYTRFVGPVSGPERKVHVHDALSGGTRVDFIAKPAYQFAYGVEDGKTRVLQNRKESRDGDAVKGVYSVVDPDGSLRVVKYTADNVNGFQAEVITNGIATLHGHSGAVASGKDNALWYPQVGAELPPAPLPPQHQYQHQQQQLQQPRSYGGDTPSSAVGNADDSQSGYQVIEHEEPQEDSDEEYEEPQDAADDSGEEGETNADSADGEDEATDDDDADAEYEDASEEAHSHAEDSSEYY